MSIEELFSTGVTYLRGAVDPGAIEDQIWEYYAAQGIARDDRSTWPSNTLESKLQRLRKTGMFSAFGSDIVRAALAEVLGDDWHELDAWGAPLITFPQPGPWELPTKLWHSDFPARGNADAVMCLRLFGFVTPVGPQGGGTLAIEGSHELIRRMVEAAPGNDAGSSAVAKKQLFRAHPWFRAPSFDPIEIDGVTVRVHELTGQPGDVALMLPWTLHNISMNCSDRPRFMVTHTAYRKD
jgi:hypothetical protein